MLCSFCCFFCKVTRWGDISKKTDRGFSHFWKIQNGGALSTSRFSWSYYGHFRTSTLPRNRKKLVWFQGQTKTRNLLCCVIDGFCSISRKRCVLDDFLTATHPLFFKYECNETTRKSQKKIIKPKIEFEKQSILVLWDQPYYLQERVVPRDGPFTSTSV